jgi:hypothetical protein
MLLIGLCFGLAGEAIARSPEDALTGSDFLSACSKPEPDWIGFCHGYVQGIHDGVTQPEDDFCPPAGTTRADMVGIVVRQLKATPSLQGLNAASVVYAVFLKAYPC